jgi:hypothetical protein
MTIGRMLAGVAALSLCVGATTVRAYAPHVVGVVTKASAASGSAFELRTHGNELLTIATDDQTVYRKWIMNKPWGQDTRATRGSVDSGRCIRVQLRGGDAMVASVVHVSHEPPASLFDPCKSLR